MTSIQYRPTGRTAREISVGVESAIRDGALPPGAPLPSVRALAAELDLAPGTVAAAYALLRDRGLVETNGRRGTSVTLRPPLAARSSGLPIAAGLTDLSGGQPDPALLPDLPSDFLAGSHLPSATGLSPEHEAISGQRAAAPAEPVLPELRALGRERLLADGVPAENLTLASGGLDSIHRVLSAQLRQGDLIAVEDPGWPNVLDLIAALGLRPHPLLMDGAGPLPASLIAALRAGARAVIVTNRAQNPTGAYLSPARAGELRLVLADHPQTLVIEDDHAAELAGVPLASLAGATGSWAFIRSTSKPYGPDLRTALISGDETTIARVEGRLRVGAGWVSTLLQRVVVALWTSPDAATTVARAARVYDERRTGLIAELAHHGIDSTGATGLNVWIPVADETTAVARLVQAGWAVAPGARFRQTSAPGLRITVSGLTTATIPRLAADLAAALAVTPSTRYTT